MTSIATPHEVKVTQPKFFGRPCAAFWLGIVIPIAGLIAALVVSLLAFAMHFIGEDVFDGDPTASNIALAAGYTVLIPLLLSIPRLLRTSWRALGFTEFSVGSISIGLGGGFLVVAATAIFARLPVRIPSVLGSAHDYLPAHGSGLSLMLAFVVLSVAGPVYEEIGFRILAFNALRQWNLSAYLAALISAAIFALFHLSPADIPVLLFAGLVFAFVYVRSKSAWAPIVAHGVCNGAQLLAIIASHRVTPLH